MGNYNRSYNMPFDIFSSNRTSWHNIKDILPEAFAPYAKDLPVFPLSLPVSDNWDDAGKRILFIVQSVDTADLRHKQLMHDVSAGTLSAIANYAHEYAALSTEDPLPKLSSYGWAALNFNFFKTFTLSPDQRAVADAHAAKRIEKLMARLQPTHVFFLGDECAKRMLRLTDHELKRGWSAEYIRDWGSFIATHSIDFTSCYMVGTATVGDDDDDDDVGDRDVYARTNLAGQVARNMSSLFLYGVNDSEKGLAYTIEDVKVKPILIRSMEKAERLAGMLMDADCFAYDTEAPSLNRIDTRLLTMQFSLDSQRGFIVPVHHRHSPFTGKKLKQVKDMYRDVFYRDDIDPFDTARCLIGLNLQFDLLLTRQDLSIPFIPWPVWDIANADFVFDENIRGLDDFSGVSAAVYSLGAVVARYGNSFYLDKTGFNKQDRKNMEATSLDDDDVLSYMAADTILPYAIYEKQLQRFADASYERGAHFVLTQMSNNSHVFSAMEHRGVNLDKTYIEKQLKPKSELNQIIRDAETEMFMFESVREANRVILESRGVSTTDSLFADDDDDPVDNGAWTFSLSKAEHKQILFSDILELEPVSGFGKVDRPSGKPTITLDKGFQEEHNEVPEVRTHTRIQKLKKLMSSYVAAFYIAVTETDDGKITGRLRPQYGHLYVVTGRGNSRKPSLQQTPSRSKEAKYVKRMMVASRGHLKVQADFSSNEVKFWGNEAQDQALSGLFNVARSLRQDLFQHGAKLASLRETVQAELARRGA